MTVAKQDSLADLKLLQLIMEAIFFAIGEIDITVK